MKKSYRLFAFGLLLLAGLMLSACNATLPASTEVSTVPEAKSAQVEFAGTIDAIQPGEWVIGGQIVRVSGETSVNGAFAVGDEVHVAAAVSEDGAVTAQRIEMLGAYSSLDDSQSGTDDQTPEQEFTGVVEAIGADSWTVGGQTFVVNNQTEIKGNIVVGDTVKVHALVAADGSLTATEIELESGAAGDDDANDDQQGEIEITGVVEALSADSITVSGQTFLISALTEIEDQIAVGDTVKVEAFTNAGGTLEATEIEKVDSDGIGEIEITGVVEALSADSITVSGQTFLISALTEIEDQIAVGDTVKVEAFTNAGGTLEATEIEKVDSDGIGDDDDSGDDPDGDDNGDDDPDGDDNGDDDPDGDDNGDDDPDGDDNGDDDPDGDDNGDDDPDGDDNGDDDPDDDENDD